MRVEDWLRRYPAALIGIHALCFWPVWRWYAARLLDGSDEPWGIAALCAAVALTWPRDHRFRLEPADALLKWAAGFTVLYALVTPIAPPMVRALLAGAALACSWCCLARARRSLPVIALLVALSLPVIASLQFYLGYPLRAITAAGASEVLRVGGYDVERIGTAMQWQGRVVLVDAPCSGVRMLWAGAFLTCILIARSSRIGWSAPWITLFLVVPAALAANTVRAAILFILEIRPEPVSDFAHALVGCVTFILLGLAIMTLHSTAFSRWSRA